MNNREISERLAGLDSDMCREVESFLSAFQAMATLPESIAKATMRGYLNESATFAIFSIAEYVLTLAKRVDLNDQKAKDKVLQNSEQLTHDWAEEALPLLAVQILVGIDPYDKEDFDYFCKDGAPIVEEVVRAIFAAKVKVHQMREVKKAQ